MGRLLAAIWLFSAALAQPASAAERLPIFDAHVHYSQSDWSAYPPEKIVEILRAAGVARALVSSTPDDGTLKLYRLDKKRFVPELRPYRAGIGSGDWFADKATIAYLRERLKRGIYVGIGEFHLHGGQEAGAATARAAIRMAVERDILLHVHSGRAAVEALFEIEPKLRILWAHAGMSTPAAEVRAAMEKHRNLWAELSFRSGDILRGETLDETWRALLLGHVDRFLIGSDTWVTERWSGYGEIIDGHRRWLALLPEPAARQIAYKNAVGLFGSGGNPVLEAP